MDSTKPYRQRQIGSFWVTWYSDGSLELLNEPHDSCAIISADEWRALICPVKNSADWQPIETAPKDGTRILLYDYQVEVGWWGNDGICIWDDWVYGPSSGKFGDEYDTLTPTCWMPLPASPDRPI